MCSYKCSTGFLVLMLLIISLPKNLYTQVTREVGIVIEVTGKCWLSRANASERFQIKGSTTLIAGDTLKTEAGSKVKILLWNGDQRKTIFQNMTYVVPGIEKKDKKQIGIADAAFGLLKEKYKEVTSAVVETKSHEAAIRGLGDESFFLIFPRNEYVEKNALEFQWTPAGAGVNYTFRLKENGVSVLEKETKESKLMMDYSYKPRTRYIWEIEAKNAGGKSSIDSAGFWIQSDEEKAMLKKELDSFLAMEGLLSSSQRLLMTPIIYDKWNMYSQSIREYGKLLNEPGIEKDEIVSFIRSEYNKMGLPGNEASFAKYLRLMNIQF